MPAFDDTLKPPAKRLSSRARQLTLGENADDLASVEIATRLLQSMEDDARSAVGRNRNRSHRLHQGLQQRIMKVFRLDDESHGSVQTGDQQESIDEGHT